MTTIPQKHWFYDEGYEPFSDCDNGDWTDTGAITNGEEWLYVYPLRHDDKDDLDKLLDCLNAKELHIEQLEAELAALREVKGA